MIYRAQELQLGPLCAGEEPTLMPCHQSTLHFHPDHTDRKDTSSNVKS